VSKLRFFGKRRSVVPRLSSGLAIGLHFQLKPFTIFLGSFLFFLFPGGNLSRSSLDMSGETFRDAVATFHGMFWFLQIFCCAAAFCKEGIDLGQRHSVTFVTLSPCNLVTLSPCHFFLGSFSSFLGSFIFYLFSFIFSLHSSPLSPQNPPFFHHLQNSGKRLISGVQSCLIHLLVVFTAHQGDAR